MSPEANQMEYHLKNFKATYIEVLQSNSDNLRTENVYTVRLKNAFYAMLKGC
jgi:DNA-binding transcriptional regulator WhiA